MMRQVRFMIAAGLALALLPAAAVALGGWYVPVVDQEASAQALAHDLADDDWHQVQIEQHLIIRITPGNPERMRAAPPVPRPLPEHLRQRRTGQCLPVAGIAGVRPLANNRLLLFMRDRRLIGADLSRNCTARDFYLGFYVTSTEDGQLCAGRDTIHSRAGTTCTIDEVHELVPTN